MRLDGHEVFVVVRNRNHVFFSYNYSSGGGAVWSEIAFHPSCEEENGASVEILWKNARRIAGRRPRGASLCALRIDAWTSSELDPEPGRCFAVMVGIPPALAHLRAIRTCNLQHAF